MQRWTCPWAREYASKRMAEAFLGHTTHFSGEPRGWQPAPHSPSSRFQSLQVTKEYYYAQKDLHTVRSAVNSTNRGEICCCAAELAHTQPGVKLVTVPDVQKALKKRGITLTIKELGPLYRVVCRNDEDDQIVAVTNGWVDPILKCMHCEALQVFTRGMTGQQGERLRGGPQGLGLYVGLATFAYAYSKGCSRAEILAINDDEYQHRRLVRYYRYFGFKTVRVVGDDILRDVPDRLVWGGVGTRMDGDVLQMLTRWSPVILSDAAPEWRSKA